MFNMISPININPVRKELFCHKYWKQLAQSEELRAIAADSNPVAVVSDFRIINDIIAKALVNLHERFNSAQKKYAKKTFGQMIVDVDKRFKLLKPLKKDMVLYRGVSDGAYYDKNFQKARYEKSFNVKKGEVVYMPEYAFASESKSFAEIYTTQMTSSVLYRIKVPKGARISKDLHYNFPRSAKFECTEVTDTPRYKLVDLTYIIPESDKYFKHFPLNKTFAQKLKNMVRDLKDRFVG